MDVPAPVLHVDKDKAQIDQIPEQVGVKIASHGTVNGFPFKVDGDDRPNQCAPFMIHRWRGGGRAWQR